MLLVQLLIRCAAWEVKKKERRKQKTKRRKNKFNDGNAN